MATKAAEATAALERKLEALAAAAAGAKVRTQRPRARTPRASPRHSVCFLVMPACWQADADSARSALVPLTAKYEAANASLAKVVSP
jgi:hypothetical protein